MSRVKKTVILLVILAVAVVGGLRIAQVISAKKEEPKRDRKSQIPVVDVAAVTRGLVEDKIIRAGDIVPETQVTIYSKVQGWVEKINVREGDRVNAGQVLVTMDTREAEAAAAQTKASLEAATARMKQVKAISEKTVQSQIQHTKANMELAEADLKGAQELHGKKLSPGSSWMKPGPSSTWPKPPMTSRKTTCSKKLGKTKSNWRKPRSDKPRPIWI